MGQAVGDQDPRRFRLRRFQPSLDRNRILALAGLQFIDRTKAVHLIGPPGTGKTLILSLALGVEAVKAGRSVYFSSLADIVAALAKAERDGTRSSRPGSATTAASRCSSSTRSATSPSRRAAAISSSRLVNARYEKGAMILTSNRGFAEWGRHLRRFRRRDRAPRRGSFHHAVVVQIEGSSYRLREHADLLPETVRFKPHATANPIPPTLKHRGRPPKNGGADHPHG